jgi:N-acetylmuramoyl-L-alanine amidase
VKTDTSKQSRRSIVGAHSRPRSERNRRQRSRHRNWTIPILATCAVVVVIAVVGLAMVRLAGGDPTVVNAVAAQTPLPDSPIATVDGSGTAAAATAAAETSTGPEIEVPNVVGKAMTTAEALLSGAGFTTQTRVADKNAGGVAANTIVSQWPLAGARLVAGERVVLTYQPPAAAAGVAGKHFVVVIDPGHQQVADLALEPIGPGSPTRKYKVAGGATGHRSGPEYAAVLDVSLRLRTMLQAVGVTVVMTRTSNRVDVPNSMRARIGNAAHADLVVRVHMNSAASPVPSGTQTLYPAGNRWVGPIEASSHSAARLMEAAFTRVTGRSRFGGPPTDPGVVSTPDMAGFNYSTVPTIIVECGFLSNASEDVYLAKNHAKLAAGLAAGVMAYLATE